MHGSSPGTRDRTGRAVVEVYGDRKEWMSPLVSAQNVCELLLYLHSIPRYWKVEFVSLLKKIKCRGIYQCKQYSLSATAAVAPSLVVVRGLTTRGQQSIIRWLLIFSMLHTSVVWFPTSYPLNSYCFTMAKTIHNMLNYNSSCFLAV